jgi:hypothetical protein
MTAFEEEQFDVSITLAGAAEGMAPKPTGRTLFPFLRDHQRIAAEGVEKTDWIKALNAERNWLRHAGGRRSSIHYGNPSLGSGLHACPGNRGSDRIRFQGEAIEFKFWLWMTELNAVLSK